MRLLKKEQTYKDIIYYILSENLDIDDRIPTERELCEKFNISRITLRNAVSALVEDGILVRDGRNGTRVKRIPSTKYEGGISQKQVLFVYFPSQSGDFIEQSGTAPGQLYCGIEKYVTENNDVIMVQTGKNFMKINDSVLGNIDGVIIGGNAVKMAFKKISALKVPAMIIDYPIPLLKIDAIYEDQFEAGYLACKKLYKKHKVKNVMFLGMFYEGDTRLQPGYREQLRGVEEYIYRQTDLTLFKHNVKRSQLGDNQGIANAAASLDKFIRKNNIEGIVVCSNLLADLLRLYTSQYVTEDGNEIAICIITAETLRKSETPFETISLNLQKVGYLAAKYLYRRMDEPHGQILRMSVPVSG